MSNPTRPGARQCAAPDEYRFEIVEDGAAIKLPCGKVSWHPKDVEFGYAACCGRFLRDEQQAEALLDARARACACSPCRDRTGWPCLMVNLDVAR